MIEPYSPQECRQKIYEHMRSLCEYWSVKSRRETERERMEGLCFSILTMFDGCTMDLPAMDIRMAPHKDDKAYLIEHGERYFEPGMLINNCHLHDEFYTK